MADWELTVRGAVAVLSYARPPRNFMTAAAMAELGERLAGLAERDDVAVVLLTGGVPGYFVAHADLEELGRLGRGEPLDADPRSWNRTLRLIEEMPQPVIAAVNGQCWGGGCELALACTIRIAAESATLAQPEVAAGIIPGAGGTQRLPRAVGPGRAFELILSGRVVDAREAAAIGLVQLVLPDTDFTEAAVQWAERIAARPRNALVGAKRAVREALALPLAEGLRVEAQEFARCQSDPTTLALQEELLERYRSAPHGARIDF